MKIAIINVIAKEKSTGKIAYRLAELYKAQGNECRIYYGRGQGAEEPDIIKFGSKIGVLYHAVMKRLTKRNGYFSKFATKSLIKKIEEYSPKFVILLNLHGYYLNIPMLMAYLAKKSIKTIYFMCDEFPLTAMCTYSYGCNNFMINCEKCPMYGKKADRFFADKAKYYSQFSNNIAFASVGYIVGLAKQSSLLKNANLNIVNTGINTNFFAPRNADELRQKLNIDENKIILLNVAPYSTTRKGVRYFLEAARKMESDSRYLFINIGYDAKNLDLPNNFLGVAFVHNQEELAQYYSLSDALICTSYADALPNACVEALSCGTPIWGFDVSGMPYIAEEPLGNLMGGVSVENIIKSINKIEKKNKNIVDACRCYARENYSFEIFAEKLMIILKEMEEKNDTF